MNYEEKIMNGIDSAISDSVSEFEHCLNDADFAGRIKKTFSSVFELFLKIHGMADKNDLLMIYGMDESDDMKIALKKAFHKGNEIFAYKIENALGEVFDAAIHEFKSRMSELSREIKDEILKGE